MTTLPAQYAKAIAAAVALGIQFAQWKYGAGNEWVILAVAVAGTLGVSQIPNAPKPAPALPPAPPAA